MNVVSIMAHADDEMRCLGTMLRCRARGDRLFFITLTDGSKGFVQQPDISRKAAAAIRQAEFSALAAELDADYINLGEADEFLYDTLETRMKLIEAIRSTQAQLIFTHYQLDYNQDHIATHHLVHHCAMQSCLPVLPTLSDPLPEHPAIFLTEPSGAIDFPASHFVDISAFHDAKVHLLQHHASQETAMQLSVGAGFERLCARLEAYRGDQVGCEYAEAFIHMPGRGSVKPYPVLP